MSLKAATKSSTINAIIDVSKVEKTKKGDHTVVEIPTDLSDLKFLFEYHPLGNAKADGDHVSGFFSITHRFDHNKSMTNDTRVVDASFQCGGQKKSLNSHTIAEYASGWGHTNLFPITLVDSQGTIEIDIDIYHQQLSHPLDHDKNKKLRSLYDLFKKHGDVKLIRTHTGSGSEKTQNAEAGSENDDSKRAGIDEEDEAQCIRISSVMLMNASQVFTNMFNFEMKEKQEKCIKIPCESVQVIDDMVYFIITGELRATASTFDLVKLAHCYQMTDLLRACLDRMVDNVTANDFVAVITVFEKYNLVNDEHVYYIYDKLLYHFHQNKATWLKSMDNQNELPFCFRRFVDFMDVGLSAFQRLESSSNE